MEKNDELSLVMIINKLQSTEEFRNLNLPEDYLKNLKEHSTDELLGIIGKVVEAMLRHLNLPEEEVEEFTDQVKERKMGELFEHFKDVDIPAERKRAREEGRAEGRAEGHAEGHAETLVKNIESAMKNLGFDLEKACQALGTSVDEYENAKRLLSPL